MMEMTGMQNMMLRISNIQDRMINFEKISETQHKKQNFLGSEPSVNSSKDENNPKFIPRESQASLGKNVAPISAAKQNFLSRPVLEAIAEKAKDNGISPELISAMVKVESDGKPNAVSSAGAVGLMQLMPKTAQNLKVNPYDPRENLQGGIDYITGLAQRYKDLDLALAAYNAGPSAVDRYQGVPPYKETQNYIRNIRNILSRDDRKNGMQESQTNVPNTNKSAESLDRFST